jgi:hypothetical protein
MTSSTSRTRNQLAQGLVPEDGGDGGNTSGEDSTPKPDETAPSTTANGAREEAKEGTDEAYRQPVLEPPPSISESSALKHKTKPQDTPSESPAQAPFRGESSAPKHGGTHEDGLRLDAKAQAATTPAFSSQEGALPTTSEGADVHVDQPCIENTAPSKPQPSPASTAQAKIATAMEQRLGTALEHVMAVLAVR